VTEALGRGRLSERAYHYLRDGITRGDLAPGSVLAEEDVAATLGTSRTPVRQALGRLLQEGFVEVGSRRQVVVRGFTPEHKAELLILREALESVAVRRACEVMQLEDIDQLHVVLRRMRRAAEDGREEDFVDLDEEFHLEIAEGAQLPILYSLLGQLRGFVRVARLGSRRPPAVLKQVVREHEEIVEALEHRDAATALNALVEHLHKSDYAIVEKPKTRETVRQ
jgi:GntR family transcriptional regulator, rspAB operon transcriptional repressor